MLLREMRKERQGMTSVRELAAQTKHLPVEVDRSQAGKFPLGLLIMQTSL